jgi:hypothetical protein
MHNWLIDLEDDVEDVAIEPWMHIGVQFPERNIIGGDDARRKRDQIKDYISSDIIN